MAATVDFSQWKHPAAPNNICARGVILKLPNQLVVCFDTDTLRVAAVWKGKSATEFLTNEGIAAKSYHRYNSKADGGIKELPKAVGDPIFLAEPGPGWSPGEKGAPLQDPRPFVPGSAETGRGPIPPDWGQFLGVAEQGGEIVLRYTIGGAEVTESWAASGSAAAIRMIKLAPHQRTMTLWSGNQSPTRQFTASAASQTHEITYGSPDANAPQRPPGPFPAWPSIQSSGQLGASDGAWCVDTIRLPLENPSHRNIRPSGLDFFPDGRAVLCSIDGDVWVLSDLDAALASVKWQRIASGFNEPQAVRVVGGRIFVFDRNGIQRLPVLTPGEVCRNYDTFCNQFGQSTDTREFPADMVSKPGGGFYIVKGGQQLARPGVSAGRVYEVSEDGKTVQEICQGLRQPYLAIHPKSGLLTATDQQGHYMPSTAVQIIRPGAYYGYPDAVKHAEPKVVEEPALWIPHGVNQSAGGQLWCLDSNMGELEGSLLHLSYFRPAMFKILLEKAPQQAAAVPLGIKFDLPLLKAAIHPQDGFVYACGFQIWGTDAREIGGLVRIRPAPDGKSRTPLNTEVSADGILLHFSTELDKSALDRAKFSVSSWDYRRTKNYGSPHYQNDGNPGQNVHPVAAISLTGDRKGIFIRAMDLRAAMQVRLDYALRASNGTDLSSYVVYTVRQLSKFDFAKHQIDPAVLAETPPIIVHTAENKPTAEMGKTLATNLGCLACHSNDGKMEGMKGPTWLNLLGSEVELVKGGDHSTVDEAYLREAILNPPAKVRKGFDNPDVGMPSYAGILSPAQVDSILLYIKSLRSDQK